MKTHNVKCWPEPFKQVWSGAKRAELRFNDRGYKKGHFILLEEFSPGNDKYTGKAIKARITHVQSGFGLNDGYVMLSIQVTKKIESPNKSCNEN